MTGEPTESPVTRSTARETRGAAEVASRLRQSILQGDFAHGERLPPERQLAADFSVSRGTIRQSLVALERIGLVSRRMGSGTFVHYQQAVRASDIAESISPMQLMEVRFALEPQMVRLAVVNATARSVREVARTLEQLRLAEGPNEYTEADGAFHQALAECSQNALMIWLYERINEVRSHSQWSAVKAKILTPQRLLDYNDQHRRLYDALANRDADTGCAIMTEHLVMTRSDILDAQQRSLGA
ncbi:MAG: FadR/GntR family transcriptional regulator [Halofilum sp. (in: g-proteobacteria)]